MFGEGELDLTGTLAALAEVGFDGMAAVELSRDSHRGAVAAVDLPSVDTAIGRAAVIDKAR